MSGGKHSGDLNETNSKKNQQTGGDDFGRSVSRIAVAQICESAGFQSARCSALDALADITIWYICCLGKASHFYANVSGRVECNVFDIIQGLEDLVGSSQGFDRASNVHGCLVDSVAVRDISRFLSITDVPFPRQITQFPVVRSLKPSHSFAQLGVASAGKHIPLWLPAFPEPHTYVHTPVWHERITDRRVDKLEQARQRKKAEKSLLSLHQRIARVGAVASTYIVGADDADDSKGKRVAENYPFLASHPSLDVKQFSSVAIPKDDDARKRLSILEAFAPVIEAAKVGALECGASERKSQLNKRAPVHFRIGVDKKSISVPLSSGALGNRSDSCFLRDDQKDDKKRRAEMILKEAMENPQELIQL